MANPPDIGQDSALFLDFDGCLVELAPTPDAVVVTDELREALGALQGYLDGAVAIVSGRELANVMGFLAPVDLAGSGSHGMEMRGADGSLVQPDANVTDAARDIREALVRGAGGIEGVFIEAKQFSPSIHYRNAPDAEGLCLAAAEIAIARHENWYIERGKMVIEARYKGFTKAAAVETFMKAEPFSGRTPVFIGDDKTDEDGMRAAQALGGFGIKVGPGDSVAEYRLEDPAAVRAYLTQGVK